MVETIEDITAEMRIRCVDKNHSPELWEYLDRIEKAVANCNHLKMREALEDSTELLRNLGVLLGDDITSKQIYANDVALSAPPRSCDVMTLETARKVWFAKEIIPRLHGDLPLGKEIPFEEWFVSQVEQEAKGENNGSK